MEGTGKMRRPVSALVALLFASQALAACPSVCSCSGSHRDVDCSCKALRHLPDGIQLDVVSLNLSHNRILGLDGQLAAFTHLRFLDLSHNRLSRLPGGLPRSLWQLRASSNRLKSLSKNDTVHQWNLRLLDLSANGLERATFINNTLINLSVLNLSRNRFRTVPTNLPTNLKSVDLSHNALFLVLPGSLDRLPRLTHLHLHDNRFTGLPRGALDRLVSLSVMTLGDNPWACHHHDDISYLVSWTQRTPARVQGCPCSAQPFCGGLHPGTSEGWRHALMPIEANATKGWYFSTSAQPNASSAPTESSSSLTPNVPARSATIHQSGASRAFTTGSSSTQVKKTTNLGSRRENQAIPNTNAPNFTTGCSLLLLHKLVFLPLLLLPFL